MCKTVQDPENAGSNILSARRQPLEGQGTATLGHAVCLIWTCKLFHYVLQDHMQIYFVFKHKYEILQSTFNKKPHELINTWRIIASKTDLIKVQNSFVGDWVQC